MHRIYTYGLPILAIALVGAVGTVTTSTANTIAGIVMVVAPFVLKYVRLDGAKMALVSMLTAVAIAVGAGFLSGTVTTSSFDTQSLAVTVAALWAVSQAVFQLFKDNKTFGNFLK
jgi:hypothetical protein